MTPTFNYPTDEILSINLNKNNNQHVFKNLNNADINYPVVLQTTKRNVKNTIIIQTKVREITSEESNSTPIYYTHIHSVKTRLFLLSWQFQDQKGGLASNEGFLSNLQPPEQIQHTGKMFGME